MLLTKHFTGPTSMDVCPNESGSAIIISGRFHGVEYHVPAVPNLVAEWLHLDAESGTMPSPFPKGTGWVVSQTGAALTPDFGPPKNALRRCARFLRIF